MEKIAAWFEAYRIPHKIAYVDGKPAHISPIGKLSVSASGNYWSVNGRRVSRKFGKALVEYYGVSA